MSNAVRKIGERLKFLKPSDTRHVFLFLAALPVSAVFRLRHKNLWLICEDGTMARDNGYWLFKYIRERHPEVDCAFAITRDSPDIEKVRHLGTLVPFGGFWHWVYYITARKNIASAKLGKPSPALCFPLEHLGILKSKRVFLQHGIIKDDMKSLYYDVCRFSIFVTAAERERDFVERTFGYEGRGIVRLLGLARFDNLMNFRSVYKANQILLMSTWRDWLGSAALHTSISAFEKSDYFLAYESFIKSPRLHKLLTERGLRLVFFPHKGMQRFLPAFQTDCPAITIADWHEWDVQRLLMESAFCITDYSSIAMDFAYMEKPLVYYQFDYERFRSAHYGEGYFSYERDGFGEIVRTEDDLLSALERYAAGGFEMRPEYVKRVREFFTLHDGKNCERNFNAIREL